MARRVSFAQSDKLGSQSDSEIFRKQMNQRMTQTLNLITKFKEDLEVLKTVSVKYNEEVSA